MPKGIPDNLDCQCAFCKAKRGEYKGKNSPNYGRERLDITGENHPMYGVRKFGKDNPAYGKKFPQQSRKMRKNNPMRISEIRIKASKNREGKCVGKDNLNWNNGSSFEPYGIEFNDELKLYIRQRDNFSCQFCPAIENGRAFGPHHVNYNKKDNRERNLILLCILCNNRANVDRGKWQFLFQTLMEIRQC